MDTSGESFGLLQLIANDCYKKSFFFYSAKAFDILERLDPNPEYWDGKRGACVGTLQQIMEEQESKDLLREIISMLRNSSNAQVDTIIKAIKEWANDHGVMV